MTIKKERSTAQKAADARYAEKSKGNAQTIGFRFSKIEADEIETVITNSNMTKVDFLRRAVELYKEGKF